MKRYTSSKILVGVIGLAIVASLLYSQGSEAADPAKIKIAIPKKVLSVGSGPSGSLYVNYTATWADMLMKRVEGLNISVVPGGSSQNMRAVHTGDMDFGITATLQTYPGYYGLAWAKGVKYTKVSSLFPSYSYEGVFFAKANSPVNSIHDLNGRTVSFGYAGGGSDVTGRELLAFFGIKPKNIVNASWTDVGGMVKDGLVDAVFYLAGHPAGFIQEVELTHDLKFIPISDEDIKKFLEEKPFYAVGTLPPGTYKGMKQPYKAFQGWNFIIGSPDLPEEFIYQIMKITWENISAIQNAHKSFVQTDFKNVRFMNLPLHPGAARFYKEKGVEFPHLPPPPKK